MDSIYTIDCKYAGILDVACAYLVVEGDRASFIETNTTLAVPLLLAKLEALGIPKENVDYVIITHVHLDHAGGASALLQACPNATLLAHPKAAKHMITPERLIASSMQVYGEENFKKLYGEINPIPSQRVRVMLDGETLVWGERSLKFLYTRGHANHHFCIHDSKSNSIFTGDSFGIAYPAMEKGGRFIFPTTTPTDFHSEEAIRSLGLILGTGATTAYLTHFGSIQNLEIQSQYLRKGILQCQEAIDQAKKIFPLENGSNRDKVYLFFVETVKDMISTLAEDQKVTLSENDWRLLGLDVDLNAQGLVFAMSRNL